MQMTFEYQTARPFEYQINGGHLVFLGIKSGIKMVKAHRPTI